MLIVCGQGLAFGAAFGASWLIVRSRAASHRHVLTDDRGRFVRTLTWTQTRSLSRVVGTSWDMYGGIVPDVRRPGFWLLLSVSVASRLLGSRVSNFCPCSARPYPRSQTSHSHLYLLLPYRLSHACGALSRAARPPDIAARVCYFPGVSRALLARLFLPGPHCRWVSPATAFRVC